MPRERERTGAERSGAVDRTMIAERPGVMRMLMVLALCAGPLFTKGQASGTPVWRVLNDSVFTALGLSEDQAKRIKDINAQYEEERMKLNSSPQTLSRTEMDRRMSGLIADREKEVRGVMGKDQFEAWVGQRPLKSPAPAKVPAKKGGTK